jgi:hypothetical protein
MLNELTTRTVEEYLQMRIQTSSIYSACKDHINLSSALTKAVKEGYL